MKGLLVLFTASAALMTAASVADAASVMASGPSSCYPGAYYERAQGDGTIVLPCERTPGVAQPIENVAPVAPAEPMYTGSIRQPAAVSTGGSVMVSSPEACHPGAFWTIPGDSEHQRIMACP
jgi:hypothetical protein